MQADQATPGQTCGVACGKMGMEGMEGLPTSNSPELSDPTGAGLTSPSAVSIVLVSSFGAGGWTVSVVVWVVGVETPLGRRLRSPFMLFYGNDKMVGKTVSRDENCQAYERRVEPYERYMKGMFDHVQPYEGGVQSYGQMRTRLNTPFIRLNTIEHALHTPLIRLPYGLTRPLMGHKTR